MLQICLFYRQDKKNTTNFVYCIFDGQTSLAQEVGYPPSCSWQFMRGTRNTDRNTRKYITISENELWEYIDKIMELDEYKKSFNKVINKALMYGLPILYNSLFEMEEENKTSVQMIKKINGIDENYYSQITNLIKEVILNVTINKSILCSLYGIKEIETKGGKVDIKKIKKGAYRDTPDYLIDYEINGLNELRK